MHLYLIINFFIPLQFKLYFSGADIHFIFINYFFIFAFYFFLIHFNQFTYFYILNLH